MIAHASDHLARLKGELDVRTVYADLDGTLLGPGGSLFTHPDGPSSRPASTLTALAEAGLGWLSLSDNGIIPGGSDRFPGLRSIGEREVRAYHLVPDGVGKRAAVAADRGRRRLQEANCIAVGDSVSDAEVGPEVGA